MLSLCTMHVSNHHAHIQWKWPFLESDLANSIQGLKMPTPMKAWQIHNTRGQEIHNTHGQQIHNTLGNKYTTHTTYTNMAITHKGTTEQFKHA